MRSYSILKNCTFLPLYKALNEDGFRLIMITSSPSSIHRIETLGTMWTCSFDMFFRAWYQCSPLKLGMSTYHGRVTTHIIIVCHVLLLWLITLTFDLGREPLLSIVGSNCGELRMFSGRGMFNPSPSHCRCCEA